MPVHATSCRPRVEGRVTGPQHPNTLGSRAEPHIDRTTWRPLSATRLAPSRLLGRDRHPPCLLQVTAQTDQHPGPHPDAATAGVRSYQPSTGGASAPATPHRHCSLRLALARRLGKWETWGGRICFHPVVAKEGEQGRLGADESQVLRDQMRDRRRALPQQYSAARCNSRRLWQRRRAPP